MRHFLPFYNFHMRKHPHIRPKHVLHMMGKPNCTYGLAVFLSVDRDCCSVQLCPPDPPWCLISQCLILQLSMWFIEYLQFFLYIFRVVYKDDNDSERLHFCTIVGASTPASGGSLKVSILQLFFTSTKKK